MINIQCMGHASYFARNKNLIFKINISSCEWYNVTIT